MKTIPVDSSNLKEIGYDPDNKELRVSFHGGAVHDHAGVPVEQYAGLMSAASHGKYYNEHIKGHYPSMKAGGQPVLNKPEREPAHSGHSDPVAALEAAARRYRGET